ncbi:hypothetical protein [Mycolicibacterium fortuitum]|uniref:hypothetical protein n=1 Tax=Mycolicibacterium fortuitum TaxID=1766 RepID=UPI001AEFBC90|nr:hypothetical protein [Mycolicibacterium fortuitum]MBP3083105.1 hypothetical protein [Mycolicibacterium fortuitum]
MNPTERMLIVLYRLAERPGRVWKAEDLRRGISGYEDTVNGDRNWQFDSRSLRARGLIKTGITSRHTPRRTGIEYALPPKPGNLHLSAQEHTALVEARKNRGTTETPTPLAQADGRGNAMSTIADAMRRVEEREEWTTIGDLAREMNPGNPRPARLLALLQSAWCLEVDGYSVLDRVLQIDDSDGEEELPASRVRVWIVHGSDDQAPLRGKGLAQLGIGAYTLDEVTERLSLIDDVLAGTLHGDAAVLATAKSKLLQWQERLHEHGGSG